MNRYFLLLTVCAFITAAFAFGLHEKISATSSAPFAATFKKKNIVRCGPDWELLNEWLDTTEISPIPGTGNYKWKISTRSDSAQFYFNQGINTYYSFHIIEAMASFKKAARFDPECAMLYWAQALTYGPNINDYGYRATPEAMYAVKKANELKGPATPFEKDLIEAISVRYTSDSADATRISLNAAYTRLMSKVYKDHQAEPDAAALYADAMMLEHPWDLWDNTGMAKPWTPPIRIVLEQLLAKTPNHPGANHYYIHVMEASPYAVKAKPSADRLGKLTPGLSHTVHMPSHIYLRTGDYQKGVDVNSNAVTAYQTELPIYTPAAGADFLYLIHNLHMQTNNAMLAGESKSALNFAETTMNSIPKEYFFIPAPFGNAVQYIYMTPVLVNVRFGKWNELLLIPAPDQSQVFSNILYRFGRGMALVHQSRFAEAKYELSQLQHLMKDSSLTLSMTPFSPALDGAVVAENLLIGTIAQKEHRMDDAITAFSNAVKTEQNMVYNEPRDWLLNPKHYLGNAYLEKGDFLNAQKTFQLDLLTNNENGWALFGLYKSYFMLNNKAAAAKTWIRYRKAFSKADITLSAAVY